MQAPGGATFDNHVNSPAVAEALGKRKWDYVVLQEQSQRPSFSDSQVEQEVFPPARLLDQLIHRKQPAARTVFFETWGRRDGDASNCKEVPAICSYVGMQWRLSKNYAELARRNSALLAPVGHAWSRIRKEHPEIDLYAGDGVHPSLQGSYLAACVFYAALFRKSAAGANAGGLGAAEARMLEDYADDAVFHHGIRRGSAE